MKAQRYGRTLKFTEVSDDTTELIVDIRYQGDGNAFKGICLDHAIMPLLAAAPELLASAVAAYNMLCEYAQGANARIPVIVVGPVMDALNTAIVKAIGQEIPPCDE